jgi:hypothetical protein
MTGLYVCGELSSYKLSSYKLSSYKLSSYKLSNYKLSSYKLSSYKLSSYKLSSYKLSSYKFRFRRGFGISLSVSIMFRLQVGRSGLRHPAGTRDFSALQNFHSCCGAHLAF